MRLSQAAQEFEPPSKAQAQQQLKRLQQQRREAFERRHRDWELQGEWVPDGDRVTCNTCQANLSFKSIVKHNNKKHNLYGKGREMSTRVMRFLPPYPEPQQQTEMSQQAQENLQRRQIQPRPSQQPQPHIQPQPDLVDVPSQAEVQMQQLEQQQLVEPEQNKKRPEDREPREETEEDSDSEDQDPRGEKRK